MKKLISQVVAQIESGNVPWVMRFEPAFKTSAEAKNKCIAAHKPGYMNQTTADSICRTSYGLYQIMGENIYTVCGFTGTIAQFLNDAHAQEACFYRFIERRGINFTVEEILRDVEKRNLFARRYNGSTAYAVKLIEAGGSNG